MLTWLQQNKEWVFSGVGVAILIAIAPFAIRMFKRLKFSGGSGGSSSFWNRPIQFFRGWFYSEHELDSLLDIKPMSTGECVSAYHYSYNASCYLAFTNLSPFEFIVDRLEVSIQVDGVSIRLKRIIPEKLPPFGRKNIYCEGLFICTPEGLALAKKTGSARIEVRGYVTSCAKNFTFIRYLEQVQNFKIN